MKRRHHRKNHICRGIIRQEKASITSQEVVKHEEQNLKERKEKILELRELNKNNFEVKQKAMNIIRTVVNNEGAISETRIKFIAKNHYLDPKVLIEQSLSENLKILRK